MGGYESFAELPIDFTEERIISHPDRTSPIEDLVYYWTHDLVQAYQQSSNKLGFLSSFALKIVAGEWVDYTTVMHQSVKNYEYTSNSTAIFLDSTAGLDLNRFNDKLRELQSWRHRIMSSQKKIRTIIRHMQWWNDPALDALRADYDYLTDSIEESDRGLENMLPVVASLAQVADARRSFAETGSISRLTILALIFIPLTFVSSLFGVNLEYLPPIIRHCMLNHSNIWERKKCWKSPGDFESFKHLEKEGGPGVPGSFGAFERLENKERLKIPR